MARPAKTVATIKSERKSHRTKAELEAREKSEKALSTGKPIVERPEVKQNEIAHKEFLRVKKELKKIDKDDALYTAVINRYCSLYAECREYEVLRDKVIQLIDTTQENFEKAKYSSTKAKSDATIKFVGAIDKLVRQITAYDSVVMSKRKMMFDIEKENVMTVSCALRSIPKTPAEEKGNALMKALMDDEEED